jgi:hypothetical protein
MTKSITGYPLALKTASKLKLFWALGLTAFKGIKLDGAHCQNIQLA